MLTQYSSLFYFVASKQTSQQQSESPHHSIPSPEISCSSSQQQSESPHHSILRIRSLKPLHLLRRFLYSRLRFGFVDRNLNLL
ncbi:hypothetical protein QVD17_06883 [Tagetes erecta]|uniref:Uncharacterized protein n=1 Tax=Tagetes erecta TaxID=13708 RepID=A0AAD8PCH3_TARER|nr:hypothetical protein QVD17_06883 [Tagetes erecta]